MFSIATSFLKRGNFQDISFASFLKFKEENKSKIQDMLHWSEDVIHYLNIRKPVECNSLIDKKHKLIFYFFGSIMQSLLIPL